MAAMSLMVATHQAQGQHFSNIILFHPQSKLVRRLLLFTDKVRYASMSFPPLHPFLWKEGSLRKYT